MARLLHAGLSECILGRRLSKSQMVRCSNWETRPLCPEQQQYAALDAIASLRLFEVSAREAGTIHVLLPQQQRLCICTSLVIYQGESPNWATEHCRFRWRINLHLRCVIKRASVLLVADEVLSSTLSGSVPCASRGNAQPSGLRSSRC